MVSLKGQNSLLIILLLFIFLFGEAYDDILLSDLSHECFPDQEKGLQFLLSDFL